MGGEEQHEAQTAIHFASRLERALLMAFAVRTILVLRLVAGVNGMGCHLGAGHVRRVIGQLEADGGIERRRNASTASGGFTMEVFGCSSTNMTRSSVSV